MIRNEQIIMDNFYGINNDLQIDIYNMMINSLDEEKDKDVKRSLENMLEHDIKRIKDLYSLNDKGLSLKSYYTEKLLKRNRDYIEDYLTTRDYYRDKDYKENFFYSCGSTFDMRILNLVDGIFETKRVDSNKVLEFIDSFNKSYYEEQNRFIRRFIINNYYCAKLSENYIPGVNMMENDFDDLILHLFGDKVFEMYSQLEPIRKADFIFKFRKEIQIYYNSQNRNKYNKGANLVKRPAGNR